MSSGSEYTLRVLLSNYAHDAQAGTLTWRLMRGAEQLCGGSFDGSLPDEPVSLLCRILRQRECPLRQRGRRWKMRVRQVC